MQNNKDSILDIYSQSLFFHLIGMLRRDMSQFNTQTRAQTSQKLTNENGISVTYNNRGVSM
jgi:hypothetical protein